MTGWLARAMMAVWLVTAGAAAAAALAGQLGHMPPVLEYAQFQTSGQIDYLLYTDVPRALSVRSPLRASILSASRNATAPDGRELVAMPTPGNVDIFIVQDGQQHQLTHFSDFPARRGGRDARRANVFPIWSPGADWIAFISSNEMGVLDLYVIRPDGEGLRRVTRRISALSSLQPHWVLFSAPEPGFMPLMALVALGAAGGMWLQWRRVRL